MNDRISRRDACRILVASAAALAARTAWSDSTSSPSKFRLNYILASSMYGTMPLAEILPEVQKTGADSIDLWPRIHGNQREQATEMGEAAFRDLLAQNNVKLGMTTRYDLGPFGLADEIKFLNRFGGRLIVTGAKKVGGGTTLKEQVQAFVRQLDPHVALAEEQGVKIAIENHGNSLIESPDSLRYFAEYATSKNLGIALAPYHLSQDESLLAKLIEDLGPKLIHFYAWEHGDGCHEKLPKEQELKQLPGRGPLNFGPLVAALQKINFTGWTQVFMHPVPRGIPILETCEQVTAAINTSREYLSNVQG